MAQVVTRALSTRMLAGPRRQSVELLLVSPDPAWRAEWRSAFDRVMALEEAGDSIHESTPTNADTVLASLVSPLLVIDADALAAGEHDWLESLLKRMSRTGISVAIASRSDTATYRKVFETHRLDDYRSGTAEDALAAVILQTARERVFLRTRLNSDGGSPGSEEKLKRLNRIGVALAKERDFERLLGLILRECRSLLDADAGSIYIIESPTGPKADRRKVLGRAQIKSSASALKISGKRVAAEGFRLRFAAAQNDSREIPFRELTFALDTQSVAGYTALTGEVLSLPDLYSPPIDVPYTFNSSIDEKYNYRCVSMLSIPMRNMRDEVIGVIQLINRKLNPLETLGDPSTIPSRVREFAGPDLELATTLGNLAGTTLENVRLYDSVNNLFERFVMAAVRAIDQRDPSTAGHSARVDRLTLGIAKRINETTTGPFASVEFTDDELVELHYAAILHDVGKIGVREHILTKANKLVPIQDELVVRRAELIAAGIRLTAHGVRVVPSLPDPAGIGGHSWPEVVELMPHPASASVAEEMVKDLQSDTELVLQVNRPGYMPPEKVTRLARIAGRRWPVPDGMPSRLLSVVELEALGVLRGSLSPAERSEIESHVRKSREFLNQIPWTPELANVPLIAGAHHEKMRGGGYPDGIPAGETPLQARIMAVADVFDSLTASDRPYKPAIPLERACDILRKMAEDGDLDPEVVNFMIDQRMWDVLNLKVVRLSDASEAQRSAQ